MLLTRTGGTAVAVMIFLSVVCSAQVPNGIRAYPNPSAKDVRFQVAEEFSGGTVQLLGSDGRAWRRVPVGQGNLTVEGVPPGVYTLLVRNASRYARLRFLVI